MKKFGGKVLFLDRSDINTDEIIPAKYLTEVRKSALGPHCLEDLKLAGFDPAEDVAGKAVIVTRANFGCGSSREHAPWALEVNGITAVIAENFARIFRQNMFNGGMLAIEMSKADIDTLFAQASPNECSAEINLEAQKIDFVAPGFHKSFPIKLSEFDRALVTAEGWLGYSALHY